MVRRLERRAEGTLKGGGRNTRYEAKPTKQNGAGEANEKELTASSRVEQRPLKRKLKGRKASSPSENVAKFLRSLVLF